MDKLLEKDRRQLGPTIVDKYVGTNIQDNNIFIRFSHIPTSYFIVKVQYGPPNQPVSNLYISVLIVD